MTTQNTNPDQLKHQPRVLLGPGPSNLHPRVVQAMTSPILAYGVSTWDSVLFECFVALGAAGGSDCAWSTTSHCFDQREYVAAVRAGYFTSITVELSFEQ